MASIAPSLRTRSAYGVRTLGELELESKADAELCVVEGVIPAKSVNIAVGDSGLGKTPWACQLALCVASGVAFLGNKVQQGTVLYIDLENGTVDLVNTCRSLASYLKIREWPDTVRFIRNSEHLHHLRETIREHTPILVVIDSLRAYRPMAEESNREAASMMNELRKLAREFGTAFVLIHHIRKPGENGPPALENEPVMTWLNAACGARALVNQSDVRIAFDTCAGAKRVALERSKNSNADDIGLVMKGFARLRGEFGPLFLTRDCDEEGGYLGYRRMSGVELLFNTDQQTAFAKLPNEFWFKDAKHNYGRRDQATKDFLQKCERVGIVKPLGRGIYLKLPGVTGVCE